MGSSYPGNDQGCNKRFNDVLVPEYRYDNPSKARSGQEVYIHVTEGILYPSDLSESFPGLIVFWMSGRRQHCTPS